MDEQDIIKNTRKKEKRIKEGNNILFTVLFCTNFFGEELEREIISTVAE